MTATLPRRAFILLGAAASLAAAADFNGDGRQDVLWRLPSGNPLIWQMDGLSVKAQQRLALDPAASVSIVGTGRFFGSGNDAIAWIDSSDDLRLWQIDATGNVVQNCVAASGIDATWKFLAIADVNGDGRDDVLWRRDDGSVVASLIDGCSAPNTLTLNGAVVDPTWTFAGSAIDASSRTNLVWADAGAKNAVVWTVYSSGTVTQATIAAGAQTGWEIAAVADFNGDQRADVLWRNPSDDALVLWLNTNKGYSVASVAAVAGVFSAADAIFGNGFDTAGNPAPPLTADWTILDAADYDGDGNADLLLANNTGDAAVWLMNGASIRATARFAALPDMPLPGLTGWRLPMDRPTITKLDDQVSVDWTALPGTAQYTVYASAVNAPATSGTAVSNGLPPLLFGRSDAGYGDKRYFAVGASYHGLTLPASKEAYIVEFAMTVLNSWAAMTVADFDGDGCMDILGAYGHCDGTFTTFSEASVGLGALRANSRQYRDVRFADFNGDGILDAVANVYACDVPECGGNDANSQLQLYWGNGDGTFTEDPSFSALSVPGGGYGETIVVADFNNDGYLDIFLPKYTAYDAGEHNFLLINDGHGHFTDVSDAAGVAMRNIPFCARPEAAQAVDANADGRIDLFAGSHLFLNQGNDQDGTPHFQVLGPQNISANCSTYTADGSGLKPKLDEGAKFVDLDNSGSLTLMLNNQITAPWGADFSITALRFDGLGHFTDVTSSTVPNEPTLIETDGLTAADVDGDGLTDLVIAGGCANEACTAFELPRLLVNRRGAFVLHDFYDDGLSTNTRGLNDLVAHADFDRNGTEDFAARLYSGPTGQTALAEQVAASNTILVSVLGVNGEQNQQGRVVRVTPSARPDITMLQIVDGGSGYMANGPYDLTFATPYFGAYTISVRFANATYTAVAHTGEHVTLYGNGTVSIQPRQ